MAEERTLQQTIGTISNHSGPVLSVYLSVNPAIPENQGQAYLVRLKNELENLDVPEEVSRRTQEFLEGEKHGARTFVIFADGNDLFQVYRAQVDLPEEIRWEEPYTAPLMLALDEHRPCGVALLDAERFRYFVESLVEEPDESAEEIKSHGFREVDISPSEPYPRGGSDYEPSSRRTEANVSQFFNELVDITRRVTFREGVRRLILAGPKERTSEFREKLPEDVEKYVIAEEHVPLGAKEGEILDRLEEIRAKAEYEQGKELLAEVRERGVRGLDETITALQEENRVHHLLVLWELDGEVRWSEGESLIIQDVTQEESPYSGEETRVRSLTNALMDLAVSRGARISFFRGENENADTLREEFGGVAGLTRFQETSDQPSATQKSAG